MPWKEPGKGDKDPWKSGNQQPPDLEEVFRNVSNRYSETLATACNRYLVGAVARAVTQKEAVAAVAVPFHWYCC